MKFTKAWLLSDVTSLMLEMQGTAGMLTGPEVAPFRASPQAWWLRAPGEHIGGGTDEILLNVTGERVLSMPAEARPDKDGSFDSS